MKKLANLKGVKTLSKNEQKSLKGGYYNCIPCLCYRFVVVVTGGVIQFEFDSYRICIGQQSCAAGYTMECM